MAIEHTVKTRNGPQRVTLTPMKAIRHKCLDCSCWQTKEIRLCPVSDCALWPFRFGRNPVEAADSGR